MTNNHEATGIYDVLALMDEWRHLPSYKLFPEPRREVAAVLKNVRVTAGHCDPHIVFVAPEELSSHESDGDLQEFDTSTFDEFARIIEPHGALAKSFASYLMRWKSSAGSISP